MKRSDKILHAIGSSFFALSNNGSIFNSIQDVLSILGEAAEVDRVYIFKNHKNTKGEEVMSQLYEWAADSVSIEINKPELQGAPWEMFGNLRQRLLKDKVINELVEENPSADFRLLMSEQGILTYLFIPIFCGDHFWGFIGFDDCHQKCLFTQEQLFGLHGLASTIGDKLNQYLQNEKLKNTVRQYQLVSQNTKDLIFLLSHDYTIKYASPSVKKTLGHEAESVLGKQWTELFGPLKLESFKKHKAQKVMVSHHRKGEEVILEMLIAPLDGGQSGDLIATGRDVTEREKLTCELAQALEKEKELNILKSRFISIVSHEFRTPISTIMSSVELLGHYCTKDKLEDSDKIKNHLRRIENEMGRLTTILNDIVTLEKNTTGKIKVNPKRVKINEFLLGMIDDFYRDRTDGRTPELHLLEKEITLKSDPILLLHIMTNLINNALKFSAGSPPPIVVASHENGIIKISVQDFGIGISKKDRPLLFDSFYRGTNAKNIEGTGLGLTVVKVFCDAIGASVGFETKKNSGSRFEVILPLTVS